MSYDKQTAKIFNSKKIHTFGKSHLVINPPGHSHMVSKFGNFETMAMSRSTRKNNHVVCSKPNQHKNTTILKFIGRIMRYGLNF